MVSARACRDLAAAVSVCLASLGAVAQDALMPPPTSAYLQWGPLWARPAVRLINVGFNSNVFNSAVGEGDFTATIAPQLNGMLLFGDTAYMTFFGAARFTAYETFAELNYWDVLARERVYFPLGRWGLFTGLRFDRVRRSPVDLDAIRPVEELRRFDAGAILKLGPRSSFTYTFRHSDFKNFDDDLGNLQADISQIQDRTERSHIFDIESNILARTIFRFQGETTLIDFDTPSLSGIPELSRDSRAITLLPGISLGDYGSIVGNLQIGWAQLDYEGEAIQDYDGLVGEADIVYNPLDRTSLQWEAWRRVGYSVTALNNFYIDEKTRLGLVHFFNRVVGFDARVGIGNLEIPATGRKDKVLSINVGVRLRSFTNSMGRRVEYSLNYGRSNRDSSNPTFNRDYDSLGFNAYIGY